MTAPFVVPSLSKPILLAKFFRALGDPTRLRILQAVLEEEKNVTELIRITGAPPRASLLLEDAQQLLLSVD